MPSHKYDDPTITPVEFHFAVMHDPDLPIELRMEAAAFLISTDYGHLLAERPPAIIYKIEDFRDA
jgi:hypothetical protein